MIERTGSNAEKHRAKQGRELAPPIPMGLGGIPMILERCFSFQFWMRLPCHCHATAHWHMGWMLPFRGTRHVALQGEPHDCGRPMCPILMQPYMQETGAIESFYFSFVQHQQY